MLEWQSGKCIIFYLGSKQQFTPEVFRNSANINSANPFCIHERSGWLKNFKIFHGILAEFILISLWPIRSIRFFCSYRLTFIASHPLYTVRIAYLPPDPINLFFWTLKFSVIWFGFWWYGLWFLFNVFPTQVYPKFFNYNFQKVKLTRLSFKNKSVVCTIHKKVWLYHKASMIHQLTILH